eukprot:1382813-Pyramimonas_sp.AAC.1
MGRIAHGGVRGAPWQWRMRPLPRGASADLPPWGRDARGARAEISGGGARRRCRWGTRRFRAGPRTARGPRGI